MTTLLLGKDKAKDDGQQSEQSATKEEQPEDLLKPFKYPVPRSPTKPEEVMLGDLGVSSEAIRVEKEKERVEEELSNTYWQCCTCAHPHLWTVRICEDHKNPHKRCGNCSGYEFGQQRLDESRFHVADRNLDTRGEGSGRSATPHPDADDDRDDGPVSDAEEIDEEGARHFSS